MADITPDDIRALRVSTTGLTQGQFAARYRLGLVALRNWEQGRRHPGPAAALLLRLIEAYPDDMEAMIATLPQDAGNVPEEPHG